MRASAHDPAHEERGCSGAVYPELRNGRRIPLTQTVTPWLTPAAALQRVQTAGPLRIDWGNRLSAQPDAVQVVPLSLRVEALGYACLGDWQIDRIPVSHPAVPDYEKAGALQVVGMMTEVSKLVQRGERPGFAVADGWLRFLTLWLNLPFGEKGPNQLSLQSYTPHAGRQLTPTSAKRPRIGPTASAPTTAKTAAKRVWWQAQATRQGAARNRMRHLQRLHCVPIKRFGRGERERAAQYFRDVVRRWT